MVKLTPDAVAKHHGVSKKVAELAIYASKLSNLAYSVEDLLGGQGKRAAFTPFGDFNDDDEDISLHIGAIGGFLDKFTAIEHLVALRPDDEEDDDDDDEESEDDEESDDSDDEDDAEPSVSDALQKLKGALATHRAEMEKELAAFGDYRSIDDVMADRSLSPKQRKQKLDEIKRILENVQDRIDALQESMDRFSEIGTPDIFPGNVNAEREDQIHAIQEIIQLRREFEPYIGTLADHLPAGFRPPFDAVIGVIDTHQDFADLSEKDKLRDVQRELRDYKVTLEEQNGKWVAKGGQEAMRPRDDGLGKDIEALLEKYGTASVEEFTVYANTLAIAPEPHELANLQKKIDERLVEARKLAAKLIGLATSDPKYESLRAQAIAICEATMRDIPAAWIPPSFLDEVQAWRKAEREHIDEKVASFIEENRPQISDDDDETSRAKKFASFAKQVVDFAHEVGDTTLTHINPETSSESPNGVDEYLNGLLGHTVGAGDTGAGVWEGFEYAEYGAMLISNYADFAQKVAALASVDLANMTDKEKREYWIAVAQAEKTFADTVRNIGNLTHEIAEGIAQSAEMTGMMGGLGVFSELMTVTMLAIEAEHARAMKNDAGRALAEMRNAKAAGEYVDPGLEQALLQESDSRKSQQRRKAWEATAHSVTAAGYVGDAAGAGGIGLGLKLTGKVMEYGGKIVFAGIDIHNASSVRKLMREAQAGNVTAQIAIMRDSAYYAKMYLALLVMDNDPRAVDFIVKRGYREADLHKPGVSAKILREFMMSDADDHDEVEGSKMDIIADTGGPAKLISKIDSARRKRSKRKEKKKADAKVEALSKQLIERGKRPTFKQPALAMTAKCWSEIEAECKRCLVYEDSISGAAGPIKKMEAALGEIGEKGVQAHSRSIREKLGVRGEQLKAMDKGAHKKALAKARTTLQTALGVLGQAQLAVTQKQPMTVAEVEEGETPYLVPHAEAAKALGELADLIGTQMRSCRNALDYVLDDPWELPEAIDPSEDPKLDIDAFRKEYAELLQKLSDPDRDTEEDPTLQNSLDQCRDKIDGYLEAASKALPDSRRDLTKELKGYRESVGAEFDENDDAIIKAHDKAKAAERAYDEKTEAAKAPKLRGDAKATRKAKQAQRKAADVYRDALLGLIDALSAMRSQCFEDSIRKYLDVRLFQAQQRLSKLNDEMNPANWGKVFVDADLKTIFETALQDAIIDEDSKAVKTLEGLLKKGDQPVDDAGKAVDAAKEGPEKRKKQLAYRKLLVARIDALQTLMSDEVLPKQLRKPALAKLKAYRVDLVKLNTDIYETDFEPGSKPKDIVKRLKVRPSIQTFQKNGVAAGAFPASKRLFKRLADQLVLSKNRFGAIKKTCESGERNAKTRLKAKQLVETCDTVRLTIDELLGKGECGENEIARQFLNDLWSAVTSEIRNHDLTRMVVRNEGIEFDKSQYVPTSKIEDAWEKALELGVVTNSDNALRDDLVSLREMIASGTKGDGIFEVEFTKKFEAVKASATSRAASSRCDGWKAYLTDIVGQIARVYGDKEFKMVKDAEDE